MRSSSSDVDTPGVRRVGRNFPIIGGLSALRKRTVRKGGNTLTLCEGVDVIVSGGRVWVLVMRDVVDLVLQGVSMFGGRREAGHVPMERKSAFVRHNKE